MRSLVLVLIYGRPQVSGIMSYILPNLKLLSVTSLKLVDLSVSINMDSEMQDA